jgi:hypothetical protein
MSGAVSPLRSSGGVLKATLTRYEADGPGAGVVLHGLQATMQVLSSRVARRDTEAARAGRPGCLVADVTRPDRQAGGQFVWLAAYKATAVTAQGVHGSLQAVQTTISLMVRAR